MRGGFGRLIPWMAALSACSGPSPAPETPRPPARGAEPPALIEPAPSDTLPRFPRADVPPEGAGIKGAAGSAVPVRADAPVRPRPEVDELLRLQRDLVARKPEDDDAKVRLAILHATEGQYEEAERVLATVKALTSKLVPYLDLFLRRQLGDHKEATRILSQFQEEERRSTGFYIARAELSSSVRRYRDYVPAENDRVKPGGKILIYVEPRNFALQKNQEKFILHLRYEWKLYDDRSVEQVVPAWDGAPVSDREDRVTYTGPVEEFYQSFALPLPANLAMGHYRVRVTVTDVQTTKSDRVYVPVYVTAAEPRR